MLLNFEDDIFVQVVNVPGAITTGTVPATYIDVSNYTRFVFLLSLGATNNAVDAQVVQATAAAGTGSKNITGAAIAQLDGNDDNKFVTIEVDSQRLDIANGFRYVAVTLTVAGTTTAEVLFFGLNGRARPITKVSAWDEAVVIAGEA